MISAYDNVRTPDIFRSFLARVRSRVRSINACLVTISEQMRAADELKTSVFIASDKLVFTTHLRIWYHTADEQILYSRRHKHFWHWRRMYSPLDSGDEHFSTGDKRVEMCIRNSAMHTQPATPNRTSVEMNAPNSQVLALKIGGVALSYSCTSAYAITLQTSTNYIYAIALSNGLNTLQLDLANREKR